MKFWLYELVLVWMWLLLFVFIIFENHDSTLMCTNVCHCFRLTLYPSKLMSDECVLFWSNDIRFKRKHDLHILSSLKIIIGSLQRRNIPVSATMRMKAFRRHIWRFFSIYVINSCGMCSKQSIRAWSSVVFCQLNDVIICLSYVDSYV